MTATDPALEAAADRLEQAAPGYLARVRRLAAARAVPTTPAGRVERALELVDQTAQIDINAPVVSNRRLGRVMKKVVGTLIRFYMIHMAHQVTDLGDSVSWLGRALNDYLVGLESEVTRLRGQVGDLQARIEALEARPPGPPQ